MRHDGVTTGLRRQIRVRFLPRGVPATTGLGGALCADTRNRLAGIHHGWLIASETHPASQVWVQQAGSWVQTQITVLASLHPADEEGCEQAAVEPRGQVGAAQS